MKLEYSRDERNTSEYEEVYLQRVSNKNYLSIYIGHIWGYQVMTYKLKIFMETIVNSPDKI